MTFRVNRARGVPRSSAALALARIAGPAPAQEKPTDHADRPAAACEPSMTTLAQIQVETPGRKADDPVIPQEEFQRGTQIHFERCAGCHGVLRKGATGRPLTTGITRENGCDYLHSFITYGSPAEMTNWRTSGELSAEDVDLMARYR